MYDLMTTPNAGAQPRGPQRASARCPNADVARVGCSGSVRQLLIQRLGDRKQPISDVFGVLTVSREAHVFRLDRPEMMHEHVLRLALNKHAVDLTDVRIVLILRL